MTPAIKLVDSLKLVYQVHSYQHDSSAQHYALEAVEQLQVDPARVFKTLVVECSGGDRVGDLGVAVIPANSRLSLKLMAKAMQAKKVKLAPADQVTRSTGYVLGGVSPLAQTRRLATLIDRSAASHKTIFVSAGKRGCEIELSPDDLCLASQGCYKSLTA